MSVVGNEAAARMAYWCATDEKGGVGYDQGTREEIRDLSYVSTPRLTGAVDSDCSAMVAAACNLGLRAAGVVPAGTADTDSRLLPASTWTGSMRSELEARGWREVHWDDAAMTPDGGFRKGDVVLSSKDEGGEGHVAMVVDDNPSDPVLAEAWIDERGEITGGAVGDQTGSETRLVSYSAHVYTQRGAWTSCHRYAASSSAPVPSVSAPAPPSGGKPGPLLGVDISNWQAGIDLAAVGPDFTIVMATQGDWFVNRCFDEQVDAALALGRPTGVYHYVDGSGVEAEVSHFFDVAGGLLSAGRVFWAVDWEADQNGAWGDEGYLRRFVDAVKARTGRRGLLYASSDSYPYAVQEATGSMRWVAQYASSDPVGWDYAPWSDGTWTADMHQYTGTGRVPGYGGDLDLNLLRGGEDDLWALTARGRGAVDDNIHLLEGDEDVRVTHILFAYEGTMYLYCVLTHTYSPIPNERTLEDVKFILARAGAKVEDWLEFNRGSSLEVGNLLAFGRYVPVGGRDEEK